MEDNTLSSMVEKDNRKREIQRIKLENISCVVEQK
jgi:hypothetical protein